MARARDSTAKVDPELRRLLSDAKASTEPIEAVFTLRDAAKRDPADLEKTARALIERVAAATGAPPKDFNIFRNLGSLVVCADRAFVQRMIEEKEIASAIANRQP